MLSKERRKLLKQLGIKKMTSYHQKNTLLRLRKRRAGHARTLDSYSSALGETNPLGFTKLDSIIGAIARLFGLSIAARIVDLKVVRRAKNPPTRWGEK
jgi:hypothetical protein